MQDLAIALQCFVAASVFYVWVVRNANIVREFADLGLPDSLRDPVGILKLTCSLLLLVGIERPVFALLGGLGIVVLMSAAFATHVWRRSPLIKMLPSLLLLSASATIAVLNYRLANAAL